MTGQERQHAYVALTSHDGGTHDHSEDNNSYNHDHNQEDHPVELHNHG